jgi:hypothetical protein
VKIEGRKQAKVDMMAVKWPKGDRGKYATGDNGEIVKTVKLAFIEMKYGVEALDGQSGLEDHLKDMLNIIDSGHLETIRQSTEEQLNTLNEFGLIEHTNKNCRFVVECENNPEYIMLLANLEPYRKKLEKAFEVCSQYADDNKFKLRFFIANTAGYGLFEDCVVDYGTFINQIKSKHKRKTLPRRIELYPEFRTVKSPGF